MHELLHELMNMFKMSALSCSCFSIFKVIPGKAAPGLKIQEYHVKH